MKPMDTPALSVIIVSYYAENTIGNCLQSLKEQTASQNFEIIVVDSSKDGTGDLVAATFPEVRLYRFRKRKFPGEARNIGIAQARSCIIAFIDADCVAAPNWIEEILKAHRSEALVIGGAIGNANPESYVGWGAYFCEFSQWMPGGRACLLVDMPTANLSYKRDVFDRCGGFIEGGYCSDTELHWRLTRDGERLWFVPSIAVSHHNIGRFVAFLRHEFFHGRSFAQVRVRSQGFSGLRRLVYAVLWPLIAGKLLAEVVWRALRRAGYRRPFLLTCPVVALGILCWSLGEMSGYIIVQRSKGLR